jgi:serine protease Do
MSGLPDLLALAVLLAPGPQESPDDRRRTPVVEAVERVKPAVVSITTNVQRQRRDIFGGVFVADSPGPSGTGVVIYEDGFIITNFHVVEGASQIQVRFDAGDDARAYDAQVVSKKKTEDLALLKIEGELPFTTVRLCESEPILGEPVIAIGNAFGHSHTVSTGIVSGLHRNVATREGQSFDNLIQTDASINLGNSGGPLLNINGELIGINTAMQNQAENIGFAIPVSHVRKVLSEQLLALSEARAWLGFEVDERDLTVQGVVPGGPADEAGLRAGDRLKALNGHLLASLEGDVRDVYRRVRLSIQPLERVPVTVQRGKAEREVTLDAWNKVDGILFERLGLVLETVRIGPRGGKPYLHVTAVQAEGPAGRAGVLVGDVITWMKRERWLDPIWFQHPEDLAVAITRLPAGTVLTLELWRDLNENDIYFERDAVTDYSEGLTGPITLR